jgi:hypothetical protein
MQPQDEPSLIEDDTDEPERSPVWSQLRQDVAVTLWPSFLAASVATMFFFAFFDPSVFGQGAEPPAWLRNPRAGYAVGFFFFWAMSTLSSALTLYLVRTAHTAPPADPRPPDRMREGP